MTKNVYAGVVLLGLFAVLGTNLQARAQTPTVPPHFDHIVIIIQENRTPDNLFGGDPASPSTTCGGFNGFTQFIDLSNGGANAYASGGAACTFLSEVTSMNPGGGTHSNEDWQGQWDNGALDGACNPTTDKGVNCATAKGPYTYVEQSVTQPYLDIANNYAWANYMFQTNEGPSFPAHQFLFGGTSAPVWPTETYANYFVADNPTFSKSGCTDQAPNLEWVDPTGDPTFNYPTPTTLGVSAYECYDHNTMVTTQAGATGAVTPRIDKAGGNITWAYYAASKGIIWDAPEAVPQTCYGAYQAPTPGAPCSGTEYDHVRLPVTGNSAPIFDDIAGCKLQKITWVTPAEAWSDHPGSNPTPSAGPSWVADIIDAIGQSITNSSGACDYWTAEPTAIFVVWDDWGGFFDHVPPPYVARGTGTAPNFTCSTPNGNDWGCGYTYGFRVPMLVVSPYTKAGTVSGPLPAGYPPKWPPPYSGPYTANPYPNPCWIHDFGSILAFTEQNFYPARSRRIAPSGFVYADDNTFDTECNGTAAVPLWEFFNSSTILPFTAISAPYAPTYFETYTSKKQADGTYPTLQGPDADDDDQ
jgi:phospholipase C